MHIYNLPQTPYLKLMFHLFRKNLLKGLGGYRPAFRQAQDVDLWLRMAEHSELANLPEYLYRWRLRPDGIGAKKWENQRDYGELSRLCAKQRRMGKKEPEHSLNQIQRRSVRKHLSRLRPVNPIAEYSLRIGMLYFEKGSMIEARYRFFHALQCEPLNIYAWLLLGLTYLPTDTAFKLRKSLQNIYHTLVWK